MLPLPGASPGGRRGGCARGGRRRSGSGHGSWRRTRRRVPGQPLSEGRTRPDFGTPPGDTKRSWWVRIRGRSATAVTGRNPITSPGSAGTPRGRRSPPARRRPRRHVGISGGTRSEIVPARRGASAMQVATVPVSSDRPGSRDPHEAGARRRGPGRCPRPRPLARRSTSSRPARSSITRRSSAFRSPRIRSGVSVSGRKITSGGTTTPRQAIGPSRKSRSGRSRSPTRRPRSARPPQVLGERSSGPAVGQPEGGSERVAARVEPTLQSRGQGFQAGATSEVERART